MIGCDLGSTSQEDEESGMKRPALVMSIGQSDASRFQTRVSCTTFGSSVIAFRPAYCARFASPPARVQHRTTNKRTNGRTQEPTDAAQYGCPTNIPLLAVKRSGEQVRIRACHCHSRDPEVLMSV